MTITRRILPAAVFVLLLGSFLRFHLLEAQSFWNDEGNSARLSERSIPAIIDGTASDVHPPLYYLALRGWRELAGETEFGLRAFSSFAGILTVAATVAVTRRVAGGRAAIIAGLLAAVSPVLVYYSQETRMYALLALLAVLSAWTLLNWLAGLTERGLIRPAGWAAAYILFLAAGLYTHYFFPAVLVAQGAVVGAWWLSPRWVVPNGKPLIRRGRHVIAWLGLATAAVALYLPWAPVFLRQIGGRTVAPVGLMAFVRESGRWLVLGSTVPDAALERAMIAAAALLTLGIAAGRRRSVVPLLLVVIPLTLMYLVGATDPAFSKFLLVAVPFITILAGLAWQRESRWNIAALALTTGLLAGSLVSLEHLYTDPAFARADYRGMAARIATDAYANAGIILNAPNQWEAFTYYHRDGAPVYPLPRSRPDPAILYPELERIAAAHDRLYALYWGEAQRDPARVVERWLDANTFKASEEWVGDVRFVVYAVPHETTAAPTPSGAEFTGLDGETLTLHEYAVWPEVARPDDVVEVRLVWSADQTPARPYKVFLHLLDGAGNVVAQRDSEPAGGSRPTPGWMPDERLIDNYGLFLPGDLQPGSYSLRLGMYDAFDPSTRLAVAGSDSLILLNIVVEPDS